MNPDNISHLKPNYPISTPKKTLPLNNYNAKFRSCNSSNSISSLANSLDESITSNNSLSHTPRLTPLTSNNSTEYFSSPQDDYLNFIEPYPVLPPNYNTLPPGGCPKFPSYNSNNDNLSDNLPGYSPAAYKVGTVFRKMEWLNPYEPATSRSWKPVLMELNSTQLNLYAIPSSLEQHVLSFQPVTPTSVNSHPDSPQRHSIDENDHYCKLINSYVTNDTDLQFFKYCQRLNLLSQDKSQKRLIRSYSLQYCKIGLASDYKKRSNVLRIRVESEQLLLNFHNVKDLIDWNLALNVGKDLALDLQERDLPRYRTVPRRRRAATYEGSGRALHSLEYLNDSRRSRSNSEPEDHSFSNQISKLKSKLKRNNDVENPNRLNNQNNSFRLRIRSFSHSGGSSTSNDKCNNSQSSPSKQTPRMRSSSSVELSTIILSNRRDNDNEDDEEEEEDIQHMSDLHCSDDEEEEEEDDEDIPVENNDVENGEGSRRSRNSSLSSRREEYVKWKPELEKPQSQRKYYRNCLRCIKPLSTDDSWVSKSLVKPTTLSPLNMQYLKTSKYPSSFSSLSLSSHNNSANSSTQNLNNVNNANNTLTLPDNALTKVPNHFVKEFIVGSHGLVPREPIL